jgi:Contractile injection system tube protein
MLKKLTIEAVPDSSGGLSPLPFEAQYNPTSYKHSYRNNYQNRQGINTSGSKAVYLVTAPEVLHLTMILEKSILKIGFPKPMGLGAVVKSVYDQVQAFLLLAYKMNGTTHAPRGLKVIRGNMTFECVLESADVSYTAFDETGAPIRAELDVQFRGSTKDPMGSTAKSSPDLTHAHTVKDWQNLPMITEEIYGDPHMYLLVAEANGLDHFRAMKPGKKLHFPPTEKDHPAA